MCADLNSNRRPAPGTAAKPEPKAEKVRSPRYDWEHDISVADAPGAKKPGSIAARIREFFRALFRSGRGPFDRDDDADPMAA